MNVRGVGAVNTTGVVSDVRLASCSVALNVVQLLGPSPTPPPPHKMTPPIFCKAYTLNILKTCVYIYIYGTPPPKKKTTFLVTLLVFGVDLERNSNPISLCLR